MKIQLHGAANILTEFTSNAIIPSTDTIIESKKPTYFWVPTLRNWCKYYSCQDYLLNNYREKVFANSFIYLTQWNGKNGWTPFINLNNLNFLSIDVSDDISDKDAYYEYAKLKNKNYYLNRNITSNIIGNYHVAPSKISSKIGRKNKILMYCLDGYFLLNNGEKFTEKNINTFESLKLNKVYIEETGIDDWNGTYAYYFGRAIIPFGLLSLNKYQSSIPKLSYFQFIEGTRCR